MKKIILTLLFFSTAMVLSSNQATAAIPIQENIETIQTVVVQKSEHKKENRIKRAINQRIAKKVLKQSAAEGNQLLSVIVAIFIPFLGVAIYQNGITTDFWICLLLTLLLFLPGLIYALFKILA